MPPFDDLDNRARELARNGSWNGEALECNLELLVLNPHHVPAYFRLARYHEYRGQYSKAKEYWSQAGRLELTRRDREFVNRALERIDGLFWPEYYSEQPVIRDGADHELFHFSDTRNMDSILQRGLLSWHLLEMRELEHCPASNDTSRVLDRRMGLSNYIRLSIQQDHPMIYRAQQRGAIQEVAWFRISNEIFMRETNLYSDTNATANRATISNDPNTALQSTDPQAEILVEGIIEPNYITPV